MQDRGLPNSDNGDFVSSYLVRYSNDSVPTSKTWLGGRRWCRVWCRSYISARHEDTIRAGSISRVLMSFTGAARGGVRLAIAVPPPPPSNTMKQPPRETSSGRRLRLARAYQSVCLRVTFEILPLSSASV